MSADAKISARILAYVAAGYSLPMAIDTVLGNGTWEKIATDLYDAFRAAPSGRWVDTTDKSGVVSSRWIPAND